jgi:hypothetical protein
MVTSGDDLAGDIRWFFDVQWDPPSIANERERERLQASLPCLLTGILGKESRLTRDWKNRIRETMKRLDFYTGKLKKRPPLEQLARHFPAKATAPPRGSPIELFAYTKLTTPECKRDPVTCSGANEAHVRAKKAGSRGLAISVNSSGTVDDLWRVVAKRSASRQITKLQIFGHGSSSGQKIGGDEIGVDDFQEGAISKRIDEVAGRMGPDAEIWLYGCQVGGNGLSVDTAQVLADHLHSRMLQRGGKVFMFKIFVKWDVKKERVIEPKVTERRVFSYTPCDAEPLLKTLHKVMTSMVGKFVPS